ncbi:MAG TPA: ribonuclease catalytic domain-containing protein [Casimicrobiaceae bacterium]|jgi:exoribonuclease-2
MNVLFEDDGQLKTGTVLADHDTSLQVESSTGKRLKVKAGSVLLRFVAPGASETLAQATRLAADLDANFLWEASGEGEFGFDELAREYYGGTPSAPQAAAVALLLQSSPMHFYKRGKGRYRKAPPEALKAALASVERKAREAQRMAEWVDELAAGRLPDALRASLPMLLYKPDRNTVEWKAVAAAAAAQKTSVVDALARAGAIPSTHEYHFNRLVAEAFPRGVGFAALPPLPVREEQLPLAPVRAFSIDDATTTEIDDAFSVRALENGNVEIGIHIACPAWLVMHGSPHDAAARARLSTVYMPGRKLTMLPEETIAQLTLLEGTIPHALSLYVEADPQGSPLAHETRLERVPIAANLRLYETSEAFVDAPADDDAPWTSELRALWRLATHLSAARGKPDVGRVEYSFHVDWDAPGANGEAGRVAIVPRARGSPLDKLVAELMIHCNATWGRMLAEAGMAGLYRIQSNGKVRFGTRPGEHQGLGVSHYLWASSPLRRYCDLVNQRQLLACVRGERPVYDERDPELFAILTDFEATYAQYGEFQDRMERYWCLRALLQDGVTEAPARVIRDNLVRFERLPLVLRLPDLPALAPETPVRVSIGAIDLLGETLECRYAGPLVARSDGVGVTAQ